MYKDLVQLVLDLVNHDYLYFPTALEGGLDQLIPYSIWATCVSPAHEVYVMDANEEWHKVEEESIIVPELYTKVRLMHSLYKQNSNTT